MRIAVSGAAGFVGSTVVRHLVSEAHEVLALIRPSTDLRRLNSVAGTADKVTFLRADLTSPAGYEKALADFAPDTALHCAWDGIAAEQREQPARQGASFAATLAFLEACLNARVGAFIGLGSQAEYGIWDRPLGEDTPERPISLYGVTKLAACHASRLACDRARTRFAWARLFAVYGPDDTPTFLVPSLIMKLLRHEKPALTAGAQVCDLLHVDDTALALARLATDGALHGVFNVGSGVPISVLRIATDIRDAIDPALPLGLGELPTSEKSARRFEADIRRLSGVGWRKTIEWKQGIAATVDWYRERQPAGRTQCAN